MREPSYYRGAEPRLPRKKPSESELEAIATAFSATVSECLVADFRPRDCGKAGEWLS
jgi:hypothetical protein